MPSILTTPARAVGAIALQPIFPLSVLSFIKFASPELIARILASLPEPILRIIPRPDLKRLVAPLGALLAIGLLRKINKAANAVARNNWRITGGSGWNWNSEIAVVTGGCGGIGKEIVLGLIQRGIRVAILDIQELPAELAVKAGSVYYWKCDLTSASSIRDAADSIRTTLGHPSILINNAGVAFKHTILDATPESLRTLLGVNLLAFWSTTQEFLPNMILQDKGHIITIASVASFVALPTAVDYSASKAGAMAFHEGLSTEMKTIYKAPGVLTTIVHPCWVNTDMTAKHAATIEKFNGPMMSPRMIAEPVLNQILARRGGQLVIPDSYSWLSALRGLPNWFQELVNDLQGRASG